MSSQENMQRAIPVKREPCFGGATGCEEVQQEDVGDKAVQDVE